MYPYKMSTFLNQVLTSVFKTQKNSIFTAFKSIVPATTANSNLSYQLINARYNHRNERVFRKIRGGGRPVREGVVKPEPRKYGFRCVYPADGKYTTKPLPIIKMGGRHPETGKVVVRTIGGGYKKTFHWVDYLREGPADGGVLEERVMQVRFDPIRTAHIALVASGDHKRWIIAADKTKVGDIVRTCSAVPRIPVRPVDGDAYAVGALPQGTLIHHIEVTPGSGGMFCRAAGAAAQLIRKIDIKCLVQLPSKQQLLIDEKCMAVAGRASNITHGSIPIGSPQRLRWLGKRPRSGLWHRKDGYCGRKIHPPKSIKDMLLQRKEEPELYKLTYKD